MGLRARLRPVLVRRVVGVIVLAAAVGYLVWVLGSGTGAALGRTLQDAAGALLSEPVGLAVALGCYAAAFGLRAWAWRASLPGLGFGQSWAALHVSLLGNHVLPLRLGEPLRVTSVLRRTGLATRPVLASALILRVADLLAVLALALLAVPGLVPSLAGDWVWLLLPAGILLAGAGMVWTKRLGRGGLAVRLPPVTAGVAVLASWALESAVLWEIARAAGQPLTVPEAVAVTAVTIVAQAVAVAPGGLGTYEAAATAVLVGLGVPAGAAFAIALLTHAVKTAYALAVGAVALAVPAPAYWGRLRLPRKLPPRPDRAPVPAQAPVVAFVPVHNEETTVGPVLGGLPAEIDGRPLVTLVIDDGSTDSSPARAAEAGAVVHRMPGNHGLGAAVRRGLAEAGTHRPAAVLYLDADGEYDPADAAAVLAPVLSGAADYAVGSRFTGRIRRMLPHRRLGNRVLTLWVRWLTRCGAVTDGQSGYRAFSAEAAADAEIVHDYNYAQVLTLDLLGKGYAYAEVPIRYSFRDTGTSFVTLGRYLRRVLPAVHRELNPERGSPSAHPAEGATVPSRREPTPSH